MRALSTHETRSAFLEYFESKGHERVKSSSLIPAGDPTLLFTNAGMNQFKDVFLGRESRENRRAASCQKCVRAGGKHNDFENVGFTARHLTFFEMLGNFSFGDYFKKDAIAFAWELLTKVYELPVEKLWFSVYTTDDEAFAYWREVGAPADRILRFGEKDNFWAMGETGPCGPCTEIHFHRGSSGGGTPEMVNGPGDDTVEIWNLVFMQYDRDAGGTMNPLPRPCVDTGAGLERVAMVLQGAPTVFDNDLIGGLVRRAGERLGKPYGRDTKSDVSLRVLGDHSRSVSFLLADGALPANEGRGYVLRRILRRAIRHGRFLGIEGAFFADVCMDVVDAMAGAYPELADRRTFIRDVVATEEDRFGKTLAKGLARLEGWITANPAERQVPGKVLFELHDTFGFPYDLAEEVARLDHGLEADRAGFDAEMDGQRTRARASWKGGKDADARTGYVDAMGGRKTEFLGYDRLAVEGAAVAGVFKDGKPVKRLAEGEVVEGEVVLARTPFYAQGGGQVGDTGVLTAPGFEADVLDTLSAGQGIVVHQVRLRGGKLAEGDALSARVDEERRESIMRNHTATHLLHAALREVLGPHVKQAGSLVAPDRLRFDFSHFAQVDPKLLAEIEDRVNEQILADATVEHRTMPIDEALREGAMALFGEKYGDVVRTCRIPGFSFELCGGTHVGRTGEIGAVKVVAERSVASGVRRIEAVSGTGAIDRFRDSEALLARLESELNVPRERIVAELDRMRERERALEKELKAAKERSLAGGGGGNGDVAEREVKGVKVRTRLLADVDMETMKALADRMRDELGSGVLVLGSTSGDAAQLVVALTSDVRQRFAGKLDAGKIVKEVAPVVGARGGGKPDFAQAGGGKEPGKLKAALEESFAAVERLLS